MANVGRPRTFDKQEALDKAMHVFWEKGYEGTSMSDLIQAIGMKAPSLYAAFGNKEAIFKQVVENYLPIVTEGQLAILMNTPDIQQAVQDTLAECVRLFTCKQNPQSCLIMTAAINAAPENQAHVELLKQLREDYKKTWHKRFISAQKQGQINSHIKPQHLADYFVTVIQGMALRAKDGAKKSDLIAITHLANQTLLLALNETKNNTVVDLIIK